MYNKDYYINSTISNYVDYRQKKFEGLANDLLKYLQGSTKVLDYGAATGGLVRALLDRSVDCIGIDISSWAVDFGRNHYSLHNNLYHYDNAILFDLLIHNIFDAVLFLDVLEHIPTTELNLILNTIKTNKIIVRIPVSRNEGEDFVLDVSKNDKTHIQVHSKKYWLDLLSSIGYNIFSSLDENHIYDSEGVLAGIFTKI